MNKKLMRKLYDKHGDDLSGTLNYKSLKNDNPSETLIAYKENWLSDYGGIVEDCCDEFMLAMLKSPAGREENGWEVVCTLQEYREFARNQQPLAVIKAKDPLAMNIKVYDWRGTEIERVVKVEIYSDTVYVTTLTQKDVFDGKGTIAQFRGEVKGAKIVYQHKGENSDD